MIERYTSVIFKELWSDRNKYHLWFDFEMQICKIMEQKGIIPQDTFKKINSSNVCINSKRINEIEQETKHDVIAFLQSLEEQCVETKWLHHGMTSSDLVDSCFSILLRGAGLLILQQLMLLSGSFRQKALLYKNIPIIGRTHGRHAQPITIGTMFLSFYSESLRNEKRLRQSIDNISYGKVSGPVGLYNNSSLSPEIEEEVLKYFDLKSELCATQIIPRDRHSEFFLSLSLITSSLERFATQIRLYQQSEIGEIFEPFSKKQKGSSAMPYKKNPIISENICGLARLVRNMSQSSLENIPLWHERDISHSSVERIIASDITSLTETMIRKCIYLVENIEINEERIKENLNNAKKEIGGYQQLEENIKNSNSRQEAYEDIQKNSVNMNNIDNSLKYVDYIFEKVLSNE